LEDIAEYRESYAAQELVKIHDGLYINLGPCSSVDRRDSRILWASKIADDLEDAVAKGTEKADNVLVEFTNSTLAAQYLHFVKSIQFGPSKEDDGYVEDPAIILDILIEIISSDADFLETFQEAVKKYIDGCTLAAIAIPSYTCPTCKTNTAEANAKSDDPEDTVLTDWLVPLDISRLFLQGCAQKMYKSQE